MTDAYSYQHKMQAGEIRFEGLDERGLPVEISADAASSGRVAQVKRDQPGVTSLAQLPLAEPPQTRPYIIERERGRTLCYPGGLTEHLLLVVGSDSLVLQRTIFDGPAGHVSTENFNPPIEHYKLREAPKRTLMRRKEPT